MQKTDGHYKVVFFDLGKVILRFSHENIVERLLTHAGPEGRRPRELFEFLFDAKEGLCNLYDEGNISSEGFYAEIDARFGLGVDYEGFVPLWDDIFTEAREVSAIVREVQRHRPVYLLSNINELHWEYVKDRFVVLRELDGLVLSHKVKAKKPSPAIYRAAMEAAGVGAGESLFIDDMPENITAAVGCGIEGVVFGGAGALREALAGMGLV